MHDLMWNFKQKEKKNIFLEKNWLLITDTPENVLQGKAFFQRRLTTVHDNEELKVSLMVSLHVGEKT